MHILFWGELSPEPWDKNCLAYDQMHKYAGGRLADQMESK